MGQELRDYQRQAVTGALDAWKRGARSVLAVSPTGSGKTTIFSWLASQMSAPVVVCVHRRELATQAANRFREFGVPIGLIMAGEKPNPRARVQIASVPTLVRRLDAAPPAGLVICDEAHLSTAETWAKVLEHYQSARVLGVTATPWRLSGRALAAQYDATVVVAQPAELCAQGFLSPYVGFSYKTPDLTGVKTTGGDYNEQQAAKVMRAPGIVAGVVDEWLLHARDLSTIVFAVTVEHSKELCAEFVKSGVRAEHLDGATSIEQRKAILARLDRGDTQVLCNVGVAVEGLDVPRVKCIVLARPTMSLARAIQMMGRGRRPWRGLTCRIHDHAFVIGQHGLPDDERDYSLQAKRERPPSLSQCADCFAYFNGTQCPACHSEQKIVIVGDRQAPKVIDDAEQYAFDSSQPPAQRITVSWDSPGRVVEGRFIEQTEEKTSYGPRKLYLLQKGHKAWWLPGTKRLDELFAARVIGDVLRVTYVGARDIGGGRERKEFQLQKWSAA